MTERAQSVSEADRDIRTFLVRVAGNVGDYLGENLTGIYVHGSLAAGTFRRACSDVDLLIVVRKALGTREREDLANVLVALSDARPMAGDLDAHVITERTARNFQHPMPFEVQYSRGLRDVIKQERYDFRQSRHYANLALAVFEARERGVRLVGPEPQSLFSLVPWHARINAVEASFDWAQARAGREPVYAALNGAQTLHAVLAREAQAFGKEEAARWALGAVPEKFRDGLQAALDVRLGNRPSLTAAEIATVRAFRTYVAESAKSAFERARPDDNEAPD